MTARHALALAAAALALAGPPAASAQTPGDEQYTDPFGGRTPSQPERSDGGGGRSEQQQPEPPTGGGSEQGAPEPSTGGDGSSGDGTVQPAPAAPPEAAPAPPATRTTTSAAAEQLPRTGADTGLIALAGALLLAGGVALRVTVRRRGRGG